MLTRSTPWRPGVRRRKPRCRQRSSMRALSVRTSPKQLADAAGGGIVDDLSHEHPADAARRHRILHDHGEFGPLAVRIGRQADDAMDVGEPRRPRIGQHEGHLAVIVDLGELRGHAVGQALHGDGRSACGSSPATAGRRRAAVPAHPPAGSAAGAGASRPPGGSPAPAPPDRAGSPAARLPSAGSAERDARIEGDHPRRARQQRIDVDLRHLDPDRSRAATA